MRSYLCLGPVRMSLAEWHAMPVSNDYTWFFGSVGRRYRALSPTGWRVVECHTSFGQWNYFSSPIVLLPTAEEFWGPREDAGDRFWNFLNSVGR